MKKLLLLLSIIACYAHRIQTNESAAIDAQQQEQIAELNELNTIEQESINDIAKDIGIVRFTITLYKDREYHDEVEWRAIISKATQTMYRLQTEQADRTDILKELNEIVDTLQNNQFDMGIAGEITVEASDGQPMQDCCGENCKCIEMYRGNCPCSLDNARSNRCFFPQETPFDDQYEQDETSSDTDEDSEESFEDIDLNKGSKIKSNCDCK